MAIVKKVLTAVGDSVALAASDEMNGAVAMQLPAGVAGTYVIEATINGADWIALQLKNVVDGATSASANAAGIYWTEYVGFLQARVRKTAGAAAETIALSVAYE